MIYVCFTPKSGHLKGESYTSASDPKRTSSSQSCRHGWGFPGSSV